nr:hypothetical protein KitaXyl93_42340 [Kitasatospora sp. Xyl93]
METGSLCKPHRLQQHRDGRLKSLRVGRVGPVSEACEVVAGGGHAREDLLCRCTECARDYRKRLHLRSRYGLSWDEYTGLLEFQGGRCAICRRTEPGGIGVWHVDHDHGCCPDPSVSCGQCVRGIVCNACNSSGLAWYERLPEELRSFDLLNGYLSDPPAVRFRAAR